MSFYHFYIRNRKVILPTVVQTDEGFYLDVDPVLMIDFENEDKIREELTALLGKGNPIIPTPERAEEAGSVVLDKVGIKRWEAFERQSALYTIHRKEDWVTVYATGRGANGMWIEQADKKKTFPASISTDELVDAVLEDVKQQPEMKTREQTLPMLLPSRPKNESIET